MYWMNNEMQFYCRIMGTKNTGSGRAAYVDVLYSKAGENLD